MSAGSRAESAVKGFLTDYYCTSESWSVRTSAQRVLEATNSWLHSQTRRSQYSYDRDSGYVCTLSAMVIKSTTAHMFHVGDCRIYRVSGNALEQLTEDHRVVISSEQSYLGRALGVNPQIEIDYQTLHGREGRHLRARDRRHLRTCRRARRRADDQGRRRRSRPGRESHRRAGLSSSAARTISPSRSSASTNCRTAPPARCSGSRTSCRCRRCWKRGWCSTATASSGSCTAAAAATSISRSTSRPTRWSRSRSPRSTCATIPPI